MFFETWRTRIRVMGFTPGWSCNARCTVPVDIPRASAISKSVTRLVLIASLGNRSAGLGACAHTRDCFAVFVANMNLVRCKRFRSPTLGPRIDNGQEISHRALDEEPSCLQGLAGKLGFG